jgi:hypothetical protein
MTMNSFYKSRLLKNKLKTENRFMKILLKCVGAQTRGSRKFRIRSFGIGFWTSQRPVLGFELNINNQCYFPGCQ